MSNIYHMHRDYGVICMLEGEHPYRFAGVECPVCGSWADTGISYPSVNVSTLDKTFARYITPTNRYHKSEGFSPEQFKELVEKMQPLFGPFRPLESGIRFGPMHGKSGEILSDLIWNQSDLLVRRSLLEAMEDAGLTFTAVPADIRFRRGGEETLFELEAPPIANLHRSMDLDACSVCGRPGPAEVDMNFIRRIAEGKFTQPKEIKIDAASFNESVPLQRILKWSTRLVVTEKFADFIRERNLTGSILTPLESIQ